MLNTPSLPFSCRPPLAGWMGGKSKLAATIIPRIPEHDCYVEPFCGAAWVLFKKPESKVEVLNDINKDIVTLYRCLQWHLDEFIRFFRWALVSRDEFERLKAAAPETLTDIQRAARVYIECLPYAEVIARYDGPKSFFYVDPPYWACENYYGPGIFTREDFASLAAQLAAIKGKFILSLNDTPGVREVFKTFDIEAVKTTYSCSKGENLPAKEVLIRN